MKKIIIICIFVLAIAKVYAQDCKHRVALFLDEPSKENYLALNDKCWVELEKDVHKLARLYRHAAQANEWAAKILIKHLPRSSDKGLINISLIFIKSAIHKVLQIM